ncbi:M23 family metallopeptidase [Pelagibacterium xiamenense]|uniref:M23 family metallopeptidase n=1 Tax=Pelagibacterium xiamenense TaxID=2901140 RepID=UPI001E3A8C0B|nr:M23 family metallopeptidase [Pelagibacterium xiamenense]MCD7061105.1 M23 family metallopeptidase [Pelagibacterium xiamenense]
MELGRAAKPEAPRSSYAFFFAVFALLLLTNILTALGLYLSPDINALFREDNSAQIHAYEQRITELRLEVDRLHSRQYAQMGDMNLQMHELVEQQEVLFEQHEYVRALTDLAREMGISMDGNAPEDVMTTGALPDSQIPSDIPGIVEALDVMQQETRMALVALSDAATLSTREIVSGLQSIGLEPDLGDATGVGGPFIPANGAAELSIIDEANAVATALARFGAARNALISAPIRQPIAGNVGISSGFGSRNDPFLNRAAFHAGIDFRAGTGTPILAAAAGTISHAGRNGGYGNMVEIDHGNGVVTRYAHMNAISVSEGQTVSAGQVVGSSGSTGRSTGPHLHFEVRRNGKAVDPSRFLTAGRNLAKFL